ncbi:MAG: cell division protein FtsZ [Lentimonas sp.]|jgi:cell division protein FtsZ
MTLKINIPEPVLLKPKISIFGVGGAGGNALNNMIRSNLEGVEFIAANTDAQSLANSLAANRIQLGVNTTKGLGAGSFPDRGKIAAEENVEEIIRFLEGNNMVFITAGMGGGTGTGAAPVIAKLAREREILTVGVVTKPFQFEGKYRMESAELGIEELKKCVDTLIIIPNQNLFRIANEQTTFEAAFKMADNVLHAGVRGITDLITMPGLVNLDFADIRTIMTKSGKALMGTGEASGENRAVIACEEAIANPLLDDISIRGAKGVLVNMTGGPDMTLFEADLAVNTIKKEVDSNANIIFGSAFNEDMQGKIRISVVATGIDEDEFYAPLDQNLPSQSKSQMVYEIRSDQEKAKDKIDEFVQSKKTFFDTGSVKNLDQNLKPINEEITRKHHERTFEDVNENYEKNDVKTPESLKDLSSKHQNLENDLEEEKRNSDRNAIKFRLEAEAEEVRQKIQNDKAREEKENADLLLRGKMNYKKEVKKPKKEGFSLFGFMNSGSKNNEEPTKDSDAEHRFSSKISTIMDDEEEMSINVNTKDQKNDFLSVEDDDMLNVPAFFRRKK